MDDFDINILEDELAGALLLLEQAYDTARPWERGTEDENPSTDLDVVTYGQRKPRLGWKLLKTYTGSTTKADSVSELLTVAGPEWEHMSKHTVQRGVVLPGEKKILPIANSARPNLHSRDIVIEYKCPWSRVRIITLFSFICVCQI
jgi:hypothetical protein